DDHRGNQLALGERGARESELVDPERDEVGRQGGIDDRVPDRPATDQAGGFAQEQGRWCLPANSVSSHTRLRCNTQSFTRRYLPTFPFFAFSSSTAPCRTPSP